VHHRGRGAVTTGDRQVRTLGAAARGGERGRRHEYDVPQGETVSTALTPQVTTEPATAVPAHDQDAAARHAGAWPVTARIGAAGIAAFYLASLAAGAVKPGYSHLREAVSALAATDSPGAAVMIAGFLVSAAGMLAIGIGIRQRLRAGVAGPVAAGLVLLSGALMVVAGLARQDCSERLPSCLDHGAAPLATTHFWVHQYASLTLFLLLTVALFVMARGLRRSGGWAYLARWSKAAGLLCGLGIAELIVDPPVLDPYAGLVQRLFVLVLFGWPLVVAAAPARPAAGTGASEYAGTGWQAPAPLTPTWAGWVEPRRPGSSR
jgi:hypothetical protein